MKVSQIVLASRPKGPPTKDNFRFQEVELPPVNEGEVLIRPLAFSVDPYLRGRMNESKSYIPPFKVEAPLTGGAIAEVVESRNENFKKGDMVTGHLPWQTHSVIPGSVLKKIDTRLAPATYYLGILGLPGLAAYFGLMDIGKPKPGEEVVVSGAAGAVGIVVGQLARLQGCRVVGIAGGEEKIKMLLNEIGFDAAIDYKHATDITKAVADACPKGVDIYFDNVGGEISDAVLAHLNFHARIPLCGQIALYNTTEVPVGPRIELVLLTRRALMQGFIAGDYSARFPEAIKYLAQKVVEGKLKYKETIVQGFEKLPDALLGLFKGQNIGKMIVKV